MPEVSVVLPFRNAEDALGKSIQSIANQTFTDIEILLVDNASNDGSMEIAKDFCLRDSRCILLSEPTIGVVHAANKGIQNASAQLIARMDADDIAKETRLEQQANLMNKDEKLGICAGLVEMGESDQENEGLRQYLTWSNSCLTPEKIYENQFVEYPIVNPSKMVRRQVYDRIGLYRSGPFPEDYEFFLRAAKHGIRMQKVNEVVLKWNDYSCRLTRTDDSYSKDAFQEIKSVYLTEWIRTNVDKPLWVWGAGKIAIKWTKFLIRNGLEIHGHIDVDRKKVKASANVIHYENLPSHEDAFIISLVSNRGKRSEIQHYLESRGYMVQKDFILAA